MKNVFILLGTAVAWLLVSVDSHWNYGMYSLMRLFIAYVAIQALSLKYQPHILVMIALLYQPIFKIHLDRDLWQTVNVITAIYMIWLIIRIKFSEFCESVLFPEIRKNKEFLWVLLLMIFIIGICIYISPSLSVKAMGGALHMYLWKKFPRFFLGLLLCIWLGILLHA